MFQDLLYIGKYKIKYKKKHPPKLEKFSVVAGYSLNRFRILKWSILRKIPKKDRHSIVTEKWKNFINLLLLLFFRSF